MRESTKIKEILQTYEAVLGQVINFQKSEIFFNKNTSEAVQNLFQVTNTMGSGKYLGMPSLIGQSKRVMFGYLRDRV